MSGWQLRSPGQAPAGRSPRRGLPVAEMAFMPLGTLPQRPGLVMGASVTGAPCPSEELPGRKFPATEGGKPPCSAL